VVKNKDERIKKLENKLNEEENVTKNLQNNQDIKIKELQDEIEKLKINSCKSLTTDSNSENITETINLDDYSEDEIDKTLKYVKTECDKSLKIKIEKKSESAPA